VAWASCEGGLGGRGGLVYCCIWYKHCAWGELGGEGGDGGGRSIHMLGNGSGDMGKVALHRQDVITALNDTAPAPTKSTTSIKFAGGAEKATCYIPSRMQGGLTLGVCGHIRQ